jgi:hypothetical protein
MIYAMKSEKLIIAVIKKDIERINKVLKPVIDVESK